MWLLKLNDMRSAHSETLNAVCIAESRLRLILLLRDELVEPYEDGRWSKFFRRGGLLEWYNPPYTEDEAIFDIKTKDEFLASKAKEWDEFISRTPLI